MDLQEMESRIAGAEEAKDLTQDEIKTLLQKNKQDRIDRCGKELNALLQRYQCQLQTHQVWENGLPKGPANIVLVAND